VAATGLIAGGAAFFKFTAGRGAPFVDAANGFFAGLAIERGAARRAVVGAAHAAGVFGDGRGQACGHIAATFFVFVHRKVHPKADAASAAGGAGRHVRRSRGPRAKTP
jgi:hypothetical protein